MLLACIGLEPKFMEMRAGVLIVIYRPMFLPQYCMQLWYQIRNIYSF